MKMLNLLKLIDMKNFIISFLLLFVILSSKGQNWAPAGIPSCGVSCHEDDFKGIYTDTINNIMYAYGAGLDGTTHIFKFIGNVCDTLGTFDNIIWGLTTYNGMVIVGGAFTNVDGQPDTNIAMFDGVNWYPFGKFNNTVKYFNVINNELYACGYFSKVDSINVNGIAKWSGTGWTDVYHFPCLIVGGIPPVINDVVSYHNHLYVGGTFDSLGFNLAVYKDSSWQQVGTGLHGGMNCIARMLVYKDELYIGGLIQKNDGNAGEGIQKWNDTVWSEPGGSLEDINNSNAYAEVYDMKVNNNELYVCGNFAFAGYVPAVSLAKWDGSKWCGFDTSISEFGTAFSTLGFYNDTLFVSYGGDSLYGFYTGYLLKWTGGNYVDTCSSPAGINEILNIYNFILYPNPANDNLTIEATQQAKIEITNIQGQLIKTITTSGNKTNIDVSALPGGVYVVEVKTEKGINVVKFIKE